MEERTVVPLLCCRADEELLLLERVAVLLLEREVLVLPLLERELLVLPEEREVPVLLPEDLRVSCCTALLLPLLRVVELLWERETLLPEEELLLPEERVVC